MLKEARQKTTYCIISSGMWHSWKGNTLATDQMDDCQWLAGQMGGWLERGQAKSGGDLFVVYLSCHGGYTAIHTCQTSSWSFTLCKL